MEVEAVEMEWEEKSSFLNRFYILKAMAFSYMKSYILLSLLKAQNRFVSGFPQALDF